MSARSARAQPPQNSSPGSLLNPHEGQTTASGAPHFAQKRRPSWFFPRHRAQSIRGTPSVSGETSPRPGRRAGQDELRSCQARTAQERRSRAEPQRFARAHPQAPFAEATERATQGGGGSASAMHGTIVQHNPYLATPPSTPMRPRIWRKRVDVKWPSARAPGAAGVRVWHLMSRRSKHAHCGAKASMTVCVRSEEGACPRDFRWSP